MKNGFYNELDKLKTEDRDADFWFLENLDVTSESHAYTFLHGECPDFAAMLSDVYGYEIEAVRNGAGRLIHAYCVSEVDGEKAYIDVRGITTDKDLFFEEFEDELTVYSVTGDILVLDEDGYEVNAEIERWSCKDELFDGDYEGWVDEDIKKFIYDYRDYYDVERVRSLLPGSLDNVIKSCSEMSKGDKTRTLCVPDVDKERCF